MSFIFVDMVNWHCHKRNKIIVLTKKERDARAREGEEKKMRENKTDGILCVMGTLADVYFWGR